MSFSSFLYTGSDYHECIPCSIDYDGDNTAVDADDGVGTDDTALSCLVCSCRTLGAFSCGTSRENKRLKNSYDPKKSAPWDMYITNLGISPLKTKK